HVPAVLRGARGVWRVRHGANAAVAVPRHVQAVRCHHAAAHRQNGEDYFADRLLRWLRLHDGILYRLLQRQFLRAVRVLEPRFWTLLVVLVGWHVVLQRAFAAALLVPLVPLQRLRRLFRLHVRQRRHVV